MTSLAFVSLGSNILPGHHMLAMIRALKSHCNLRVTRISSLYETTSTPKPSQHPNYLNAVVAIETNLDPHSFLGTLANIETQLVRTRSTPIVRDHPRTADLDVLLFQPNSHKTFMSMETNTLTLPHPRMWERDFVMTPLLEIATPMERAIIHASSPHGNNTPLKNNIISPHRYLFGTLVLPRLDRPLLCGVINATPDSFSDGGQDPIRHVDELVAQGADALEIGGESTRPGATPVSMEEELARVLPVVQYCHSNYPDMPVSIDTSKSSVAEAAIVAGACIVNDVSGLRFDPNMLDVVARHGVGLVLMDSIGENVTSMHNITTQDEPTVDIVPQTASKLARAFHTCVASGIPRWQITLDPGLGFGKQSHRDSNALLCSSAMLRKLVAGEEQPNVSVMMGHSRKRFLKNIVGLDGVDWIKFRDVATVAATALAAKFDADIVRVHSIKDNMVAAKVGRG